MLSALLVKMQEPSGALETQQKIKKLDRPMPSQCRVRDIFENMVRKPLNS
jgi:hypothetical protein